MLFDVMIALGRTKLAMVVLYSSTVGTFISQHILIYQEILYGDRFRSSRLPLYDRTDGQHGEDMIH